MPKFTWLRSFGPIGTFIANAIVFLTTNWVVVVSAIGGIIAGTWKTALDFFQWPPVQVGVGAFLAMLWTYIGILVLVDRRHPRLIRPQPDYRYGITFEGLSVSIQPTFDDAFLQFGFQLRNFSQNPIRYNIAHLDVRIGTRALPKLEKTVTGYLARGSGRISSPLPFKKDDVKEFFGKRTTGTAEALIVYGHPERTPERQLRINVNMTLVFNENGEPPLGFGGDIVGENDEPLNIP